MLTHIESECATPKHITIKEINARTLELLASEGANQDWLDYDWIGYITIDSRNINNSKQFDGKLMWYRAYMKCNSMPYAILEFIGRNRKAIQAPHLLQLQLGAVDHDVGGFHGVKMSRESQESKLATRLMVYTTHLEDGTRRNHSAPQETLF